VTEGKCRLEKEKRGEEKSGINGGVLNDGSLYFCNKEEEYKDRLNKKTGVLEATGGIRIKEGLRQKKKKKLDRRKPEKEDKRSKG